MTSHRSQHVPRIIRGNSEAQQNCDTRHRLSVDYLRHVTSELNALCLLEPRQSVRSVEPSSGSAAALSIRQGKGSSLAHAVAPSHKHRSAKRLAHQLAGQSTSC